MYKKNTKWWNTAWRIWAHLLLLHFNDGKTHLLGPWAHHCSDGLPTGLFQTVPQVLCRGHPEVRGNTQTQPLHQRVTPLPACSYLSMHFYVGTSVDTCSFLSWSPTKAEETRKRFMDKVLEIGKKKQNIRRRVWDDRPHLLCSCATCGSQKLLCCRRWRQRSRPPLTGGPRLPGEQNENVHKIKLNEIKWMYFMYHIN